MKPLEQMDDKLMEKIKTEMGIRSKKVMDDLNLIRNWVNQQPHLPTLEDNEDTNKWLYNYLFYCKNRIEKVKNHLDLYFSCKTLMPEFYENRNPEAPEIKANVNALYLVTLPKLTPQGYRVHIFCHSVPDPNAYESKDFMRRALMLCDWKMKNDLTAGDIVIFHMRHSSVAHWSRYNLVTLSRFLAAITKAYPLRIKAIHFTLAPTFVSHIINNPFMTAKLKKRVKVHSGGNITELLEDVPECCLPEELGGSLNVTLEELNESTYKNILEMKEWFLASEKLKSDESKRPPHLKENTLFGCDGTFRTLSID